MNLVSQEETYCLGEFIFSHPRQIHGIFSRIYSPDSSQLEENLALLTFHSHISPHALIMQICSK